MKEMIYSKERKLEMLQDKKYKGYRYIILSLGTHPTAYIEIPKGHKLWGQDYDDININVHGGLTYADHNLMGIDSENWYIGWDYAHAGDYYGAYGFTRNDKKWTTKEIENECELAIAELVYKYDHDDEEKDIPLIPDDELWIINKKMGVSKTAEDNNTYGVDRDTAINYNFKELKEKINQIIIEFNEYRMEHK